MGCQECYETLAVIYCIFQDNGTYWLTWTSAMGIGDCSVTVLERKACIHALLYLENQMFFVHNCDFLKGYSLGQSISCCEVSGAVQSERS